MIKGFFFIKLILFFNFIIWHWTIDFWALWFFRFFFLCCHLECRLVNLTCVNSVFLLDFGPLFKKIIFISYHGWQICQVNSCWLEGVLWCYVFWNWFFFQFYYLTLCYWVLRLVSFFNFSFHGVISISYLISRFIWVDSC